MGSFTSAKIYQKDANKNRNGDRYIYVTVNQVKGTSSENKSTINWTIYTGGVDYYTDTGPTTLTIGGTQRYYKDRVGYSSGQFPATNGSVSGSFTVNHNDDGTASNLTVSLTSALFIGAWGAETVSGTLTMDKIDRYFTNTPTISLKSRTETSMDFSWSTSETCKKVVCCYKLSTASTYTEITKYDNSTGATSGTFSLTGLAANKTYNIYIKATRKDSGLTSNSSTGNYTTYNYPYIKNISSNPLTIGNQQTITFYNPLGRSIVLDMKKDSTSGTSLYTKSSWNPGAGENVTFNFTPTASNLYSSIPDAQSGNAVYYCTYTDTNNTAHRSATVSGTYQIIGTEVPTMPSTMFTFSEGNSTVSNIVGAGNFVQLLSTINATVSNMPTAKNNARISSCSVTIGGGNQKTVTGKNQVISWPGLNLSGTVNVYVTATDSRGLTNTASWNITIYPYAYPSISGTAARVNNYGENVTLTTSYTSSPVTVSGTAKNGIKVQYSGANKSGYFLGSSSAYGAAGSATKTASLTGINNETSYNFTFTITDRFGKTATATSTLPIGMPLMFVDSNVKGVGVNKFPSIAGLDVEGELKMSKGLAPIWKMTLPTTSDTTYYKVASGIMNTAESLNLVLFLQHGSSPHWCGICLINLKSNGSTVSIVNCRWLTKTTSISNSKFRVCVDTKTWTLYISKNATDSGTYYITELSRRNQNGLLPTDAIVYTTTVEAASGTPEGATANANSAFYVDVLVNYPVGSIYITTGSTSPASLFGGTWTHINSRFLYSTSSETGSTTGTGGSSTRTLSASNIPSHTHSIPSLSGTAASAGAHTHIVTKATTSYAGGTQNSWRCMSFSSTNHDFNDDAPVTESAGAHTHSVTTTASTTGAYGGNSSGNTASFSILPPYYYVHMWRRTA